MRIVFIAFFVVTLGVFAFLSVADEPTRNKLNQIVQTISPSKPPAPTPTPTPTPMPSPTPTPIPISPSTPTPTPTPTPVSVPGGDLDVISDVNLNGKYYAEVHNNGYGRITKVELHLKPEQNIPDYNSSRDGGIEVFLDKQ